MVDAVLVVVTLVCVCICARSARGNPARCAQFVCDKGLAPSLFLVVLVAV